MKTDIKELIAANPSGLLEMKESITIAEYRDKYGFGLIKTFEIFKSKNIHHSNKDWFAFPNKTIETLFSVREESDGDLLILYVVETIENGRVYCHLILSNEAFKEIIDNKNKHILVVHQMYKKFWQDHIVMNMNAC